MIKKFMVTLIKISLKNIFNNSFKGYVFKIEGQSTKLRFPKDEKFELCLIQ